MADGKVTTELYYEMIDRCWQVHVFNKADLLMMFLVLLYWLMYTVYQLLSYYTLFIYLK